MTKNIKISDSLYAYLYKLKGRTGNVRWSIPRFIYEMARHYEYLQNTKKFSRNKTMKGINIGGQMFI